MLDAEQARLLTLENTTADDFLLIVAVRRELGKLSRYGQQRSQLPPVRR
jgi:hypothetical protein